MIRRRVMLSLLLVLVLVLGCGEGEPEPAAEPAPARQNGQTAVTRWVEVGHPEDTSILEAPAVARVAADAGGDVAVTARSRVVRVHARPGAVVKAGDAVVDVAAPDLLEAAAGFTSTSRRLRVHAERLEQLETLRREGIITRDRVFEQRATVADLRATRDEAAATLRAGGVDPREADALVQRGHVTLRAPVSGVVTELHARPGEVREPGGEPFARIVGTAPARIEVRTSGEWPQVDALRFVASDGRTFALSTTPLASVVDPNNGTHVSWFAPADPEVRLQDGLRGMVQVTASEGVWEVPVDAVAQRTGASTLVRKRAGEVSEVRVEVVGASGATALVRGPLQAGDEVAADVAELRRAETQGEGDAS